MSQGLMLHIREDLSSEELRRLTERIAREHGVNVDAQISSKPHLHFLSSETPPHVVLQAVRKQGYHACLVDL
jgi:hypothetical protein